MTGARRLVKLFCKHGWVAGIFLLVVLLAGCGSSQPGDITIKGELATAHNGAIPKHASAHVSLVQHGDKPNQKRIVAEQSLHDLGKKPIRFSMTVGRALIHPGGHYGLNAQILDDNGVVRWATPLAVAIKPLQPPKSVTLTLQAFRAQAHAAFKRYRCAGGFEFVGKLGGRHAILRLGHRRVALDDPTAAQTVPKTYTDEHHNRLKLTSHGLSLTLDGHAHDHCARAPAKHARRPDNTRNNAPTQSAGRQQ